MKDIQRDLLTLKQRTDGEIKEFLSVKTDTRSSVNRESQFTSEGFLDFIEDDVIHGPVQKGDEASTHFLRLKSSTKDFGRQPTAFFDFRHDTLSHRFPNGGNAKHDVGFKRRNVAFTISDARVCEGFGAGITTCDACVHCAELHGEFEDVGKGEVGDDAVPWLDMGLKDEVHPSDGGDDVSIRETDALGLSGGARGIHDAGQGFAVRFPRVQSGQGLLFADVPQLVDVE